MSKLDLIRAGHTEVGCGQCGLCDVPWPCDVGVVLAALAEKRRERMECEVKLNGALTRAIDWGTKFNECAQKIAAAEARAEQAERERDAADEEAQNARSVAQMAASDRDEAMDNFDNLSLELERLEKQLTADNAALRERLATVEAALLEIVRPAELSDLDACRCVALARAALAATPAAGEVE